MAGSGMAKRAGTALPSWPAAPIQSRLPAVSPAIPTILTADTSRRLVNGIVVASIYLPNGNPVPGPKFDYKLRWFDRLFSPAAELLALEKPVVLAGDYNVMPTDLDVYAPERWREDALFRPEVRSAFQRLIAQGWIDALRTLHPGERIYTFWDYFRNAFARDAGLRIDHLLLSPSLTGRLVRAEVDSGVRGWEKASDHAPTWIDVADAPADKAAAAISRKRAALMLRLKRASSPLRPPVWSSAPRNDAH